MVGFTIAAPPQGDERCCGAEKPGSARSDYPVPAQSLGYFLSTRCDAWSRGEAFFLAALAKGSLAAGGQGYTGRALVMVDWKCRLGNPIAELRIEAE